MSTHNIPFQYKMKITLNYPKSAAKGFSFSQGLNNEFETAVVKEPSVFEPLKFYCILLCEISKTKEHCHYFLLQCL